MGLEEFENDEDFVEVKREPSPTNPFQRKSTIRVKMRRVEGETHVLCLSSERKEKDRALREAVQAGEERPGQRHPADRGIGVHRQAPAG